MLKRGTATVAVAVILATVQGAAEPQNHKPNLGRVMWSAFACATYAEMSGDAREQQRLLTLGYNAGTKFLDGINKQTIREQEQRDMPVGVLWRLGGPSIDFMIGRIFEGAMSDAFATVVKEDANGLPILDPSKWARDELAVTRAKQKYFEANCVLMK